MLSQVKESDFGTAYKSYNIRRLHSSEISTALCVLLLRQAKSNQSVVVVKLQNIRPHWKGNERCYVIFVNFTFVVS